MSKFRNLIYHSLNQYFYDGADCSGIQIVEVGNRFDIAFTEDHGKCFAYTVEATPKAVATFLDEMAQLRATLTERHGASEQHLYESSKPY